MKRSLSVLAALLLATGNTTGQAASFSAPLLVLPPQNANFNRANQSSAVGDVNGDGRADLVLYATGFGSVDPKEDALFLVYEQTPARSFALTSSFTAVLGPGTGYDPVSIDLCDLDADGRSELLVGNTNDRNLVILKRSPQGKFEPATALPSPLPRIYQVDCRDLDSDGKNDILLNSNLQGVAVFHGLGNLQFEPPAYSLTFPVERVSLGDVDGDGRADLLTATPWGLGSVAYGLAMDARRFAAPIRLESVPGGGHAATAGSFGVGEAAALFELHTVDEYPDPNSILRYATLGIHTRQADGSLLDSGTFRIREIGAQIPARAMDLADVDGDGANELLVFHTNAVDVLARQAQSISVTHSIPLTSAGAAATPDNSEVLDIDADGCLDVGVMRDYSYVFAFGQSCQAAKAPKAKSPVRRRQGR